MNQTISTTVSGPILSSGGSITVTSTGTINGGPTGVEALSFSITTLSNSGSILAGHGGNGVLNVLGVTIGSLINGLGAAISGGVGGKGGVDNGGLITTLTNSRKIDGVSGIFNTGTITTLDNTGTIGGNTAGGAGGWAFRTPARSRH
jgi:hypothetical protein